MARTLPSKKPGSRDNSTDARDHRRNTGRTQVQWDDDIEDEMDVDGESDGDGDDDEYEETERIPQTTGKVRSRAFQKEPIPQPSQDKKKSGARPDPFKSRKAVIFQDSRKNAKEIVRVGVLGVDEIYAKMNELQEQEVTFQKYSEDLHLPFLRQKEGIERLKACLVPMTDDLGPRRAQELNDASRFLKAHPAQRQEVFRNFSKSIRGQLEVAKRLSKEAEEAEALIQSVKNLSSI